MTTGSILGLVVWLSGCLVVQATDVQFNFANLLSGSLTNKTVRLTHTGPSVIGTNIVPTIQMVTNTGTGTITISNMQPVRYDVQVNASIWAVTAFSILVPDTNVLVQATDIMVTTNTANANSAWNTAESDARYVARASGSATNISLYGLHLFTTNVAGVVSVLPSAFTVVIVDATTNTTFTLPSSSFVSDGRIYKFKNVSTNTVTIDAAGSDLIDGAASFTLTNRYDSVKLLKQSTNWWKF